MPSRRFVILATVLVLLNAGLWLAPGALALRQVVVATLFGKNMVRADIVENTGQEWRLDRGLVVSATPLLLTLREADGRVQPITVSTSTVVTGVGKPVTVAGLGRGWRVLVTWPAPSGPAVAVKIEKRTGKGNGILGVGSASHG